MPQLHPNRFCRENRFVAPCYSHFLPVVSLMDENLLTPKFPDGSMFEMTVCGPLGIVKPPVLAAVWPLGWESQTDFCGSSAKTNGVEKVSRNFNMLKKKLYIYCDHQLGHRILEPASATIPDKWDYSVGSSALITERSFDLPQHKNHRLFMALPVSKTRSVDRSRHRKSGSLCGESLQIPWINGGETFLFGILFPHKLPLFFGEEFP